MLSNRLQSNGLCLGSPAWPSPGRALPPAEGVQGVDRPGEQEARGGAGQQEAEGRGGEEGRGSLEGGVQQGGDKGGGQATTAATATAATAQVQRRLEVQKPGRE